MSDTHIAAMTARDNTVSAFAIKQVREIGAQSLKASANFERRISALRSGQPGSSKQ